MIIQPKCRGFICVTAHPTGCYKNVEDMVNAALKVDATGGPSEKRPKNVVVLGCSAGYGLASRVVAAFAYKAKTIGVSFEKAPSGGRTGTAGFYSNRAFEQLAAAHGIASKTINGDAFSHEVKGAVADSCRELFGGEKVDLLIYSLASPKRTDPDTGIMYSSVIKPIGESFKGKTVDFHKFTVNDVAVEPANDEEIANTIKVMGGEDWRMWVERLQAEDLLAEDFTTIAYSYIGPTMTHAIYKEGTIGKAKDDLLDTCQAINCALEPVHGSAYVSVNKALVTQSSSAIPVVPLYISLLYKVMKEKGLHENCYDQMQRMFTQRIYSGAADFADAQHRIFMDDYEMKPEVQAEIAKTWSIISTENLQQLTDIEGYRDDFFSLFGFGRSDVDYGADVDVE